MLQSFPGLKFAEQSMSEHTVPARRIVENDALLAKNIQALAARSPAAATAVVRATGERDAELHLSPNGQLTGTYQGRRLASFHDPGQEAKRLSRTLDLESTACAVVLGFGVGHHVSDLSLRLKDAGLIVVFEPDAVLLRAVLSRADYADLFLRGNVVVLTDPLDTAAITASVSGSEGLLTIGTKLITHPPSKARLGASAEQFSASFAHVMKAVRTNVLTTLVQVEATVRNELQNLDKYVTCDGIEDLRQIAKGRPAIVVSAGPSLIRNIDQLSTPGVRDRFVIIAVQTVLKQLLERGIRPHFVTALDHHEISKRFYEGLTAHDVDGITLVAEAKSNPAILEAYPGIIRCPSDALLDRVLGEKFARTRGTLKPGATVAHLAYYLARHMGCDPVVLIGQDLGFTDGQYYASGAAIHQVWSGELSEFRTLDMLEWERIARMKNLLRPAEDVHGRKMYTDEQMSTYLVQFERDFAEDERNGWTTIDATEGGIKKKHTRIMPLAEAVERYQPSDPVQLRGSSGARRDHAELLAAVAAHVERVRQDAAFVAKESISAARLLNDAKERIDSRDALANAIDRVHEIRDGVVARSTAYWLSHFLNQAGTLNRFKADRGLQLDKSADADSRLRRQLERDATNVTWLGDAAHNVCGLLDSAVATLRGAPKVTRDVQEMTVVARGESTRKRVVAIVLADTKRSGLHRPRDLRRAVSGGFTALGMTLRRLARCRELDGIVILTDDAMFIQADVDRVEREKICTRDFVSVFEVSADAVTGDLPAVGPARLWTQECWRGGIGGLSCYDEVVRPKACVEVLERFRADAAAILGADWALVDPELMDAAIARYREQPDRNPMTFVQAPPGLGTCVIDRSVLREWANVGGIFATVGAMLGYIPVAPQGDPVAKPACVSADARTRDLARRLIADHDEFFESVVPSLRSGRADILSVRASEIGEILGKDAMRVARHCTNIRFDLGNSYEGWAGLRSLERILEHVQRTSNCALCIGSHADPMSHPEWSTFRKMLRDIRLSGARLRTPLWADPDEVERLLDGGIDVLSVDLPSENDETYRSIIGRDLLDLSRANLELLVTLRGDAPQRGIPMPWIVPHITRQDAVYEELEGFYDRWLMRCGACVVESPTADGKQERLRALELPVSARNRFEATRLRIDARGVVSRPSGMILGTLDSLDWDAVIRGQTSISARRIRTPAHMHGLETA